MEGEPCDVKHREKEGGREGRDRTGRSDRDDVQGEMGAGPRA